MNRTSKAVSVAAALLCVAGTGCTDPTVAPKSTVTSANVFNDPNSYRAFLAKIYGGLIVTGQRGPDGNADIGGIDEGFGEYLRLYWYLQEMPTDEAVIGWNDPGLPDLNTGVWGASNSMVNAMYYRVFYQVMLANEFLRQSTDAKLAERNQNDPTLRTNIQFYRAEARFLRALSYWHGIDLFGNIPLVTEADPLGATPPKQATRDSLYRYVVTELNAIKDALPPKGAATYGRATPAVRRGALGRQRILDGVELGHHVAVEAVAGGLLRRSGSQRVRFSHQRDVSEEIDPVPVAQGSEEPGLGAVELDVGPERGIVLVPFRELRIRALAQELVGQHHLVEDAIIH